MEEELRRLMEEELPFSSAARTHTAIMSIVMMNIPPIIIRWPKPGNPFCGILCPAHPGSPGPTFPTMNLRQIGRIVLGQVLVLPRVSDATKRDVITALKVDRACEPHMAKVEKKYATALREIDAAFDKACSVDELDSALSYIGLDHKKDATMRVGLDMAKAILEDGATSIYSPSHPYYELVATLRAVPSVAVDPGTDQDDVPTVVYKSFWSSVKNFAVETASYALDVGKGDLKGAVTGALGGAAATGTPHGAGVGAVAGGLGASAGKTVKDVIDSV